MLLSLTIRDFVIVDYLELDFSAGLTVLSGETGAGKSILIDALSLCLGERADASMVSEGKSKAEITACFSTTASTTAWLKANDLCDDEQDNHADIMIRRVLDAQGKSKAYINQTPVSASMLKTLGEHLIDIHGQHAFQSLAKGDEQRRLVDELGQHQDLLAEVQNQFSTLRQLKKTRDEALANQEKIAEQRERLAWQAEEIERVSPQANEWEGLCLEHKRLSHAAELQTGAQQALDQISESDHSVLSVLGQLIQRLEHLEKNDESLKPMIAGLRNADIELSEVGHSLNAYLRKAELDPERLAEVDDRMGRWHATARKLRIPPEELAARAVEISEQLAKLDLSTNTEALEAAITTAEQAYNKAARALGKARRTVADRLSTEVTQAMQGLSMKGGQFRCELVDMPASSTGLETVEFRVAGHEGSQPRSLAKVASGGELARISLAISVITSGASTVPTLIFDEVDSGIGGAVAEVVGKYLRQLAGNKQVICVTHLPQVASHGHQHWVVSKSSRAGQTISQISPVSGEARVKEIARMLGGQVITDKTTAAAEEMLKMTNPA